jgi:hypothetical protein
MLNHQSLVDLVVIDTELGIEDDAVGSNSLASAKL